MISNEDKIKILEKENTELKKKIEELSVNQEKYLVETAELEAIKSEYMNVLEDTKKTREVYRELVTDCRRIETEFNARLKTLMEGITKCG